MDTPTETELMKLTKKQLIDRIDWLNQRIATHEVVSRNTFDRLAAQIKMKDAVRRDLEVERKENARLRMVIRLREKQIEGLEDDVVGSWERIESDGEKIWGMEKEIDDLWDKIDDGE